MRVNRLALELGIARRERDPLEEFDRRPCASTISVISKRLQTPEMVRRAVEGDDGSPYLLGSVTKRHMTKELYLVALAKSGLGLQYVSSDVIDPEMCEVAVERDAGALRYVPEGMRTVEMCESALERDPLLLSCVPAKILRGKQGRRLIELACSADGLAVGCVPEELVDESLARTAILSMQDERPNERSLQPGSPSVRPPSRYEWPICKLPKRLLSEELVRLSWSKWPDSLWSLQREDVPAPLLGAYDEIQERRDREYLEREEQRSAPDPRARAELFEAAPCPARGATKKCATAVAELAVAHPGSLSLLASDDPTEEDPKRRTLYYVSDVHVEHQVWHPGMTMADFREAIGGRVAEMLAESGADISNGHGSVMLVGGDVADGVDAARVFYEELASRYRGTVVAVLGNHELWNGAREGAGTAAPDETIGAYSEMFSEVAPGDPKRNRFPNNPRLLENSLLLLHRGNRWVEVSERQLLEADAGDLEELVRDSTLAILGGCGFSGLDPRYNASSGLYLDALGPEEDAKRSRRFLAVHERLRACAAGERLVVLTHTPVRDWMPGGPVHGWTYVNGHTHANGTDRVDPETALLFDAQVGYQPRPWLLGRIVAPGTYDPLATLPDGIHPIGLDAYRSFNWARGINASVCYRGQILALKRGGIYMFLLDGGQTRLLEGGRVRRLPHDVGYYYEEMPRYAALVREAFRPYRKAQERLAEEVRAFGGLGTVHGCIVDVDWWRHLYLDPFDGSVTPYYAESTVCQIQFPSVRAMLEKSSLCPATVYKAGRVVPLIELYDAAAGAGRLPLLGDGGAVGALAVPPREVLDPEMYDPSKVMRSVQYVLDQGVIRVWNDDVLGLGNKAPYLPAPGALAAGAEVGDAAEVVRRWWAEKLAPADIGVLRYMGHDRPVTLSCSCCGTTWETTSEEMARKTPKCPTCSGAKRPAKARKLTPEERRAAKAEAFAAKVLERSGGALVVDVGSYSTSTAKVAATCSACGHRWSTRSDHLLSRHWCPECGAGK